MADASFQQLFELGNKMSGGKKWKEAVDYLTQAIELQPRHEWALNNKGFCLIQLEQYELAIETLKRAVAVNPDNAMAHANLVAAMNRAELKYESIPHRRRLTQLKPEVFDHAFDLANTLQGVGHIPESLFYYRRALGISIQRKAAISNYLLALNYSDEETVEFVSMEHFRLAQQWPGPRRDAGSSPQSRQPNRKLRIGYLSCDFSNHPVGKAMAPLLGAHDRDRYEIYSYSDGTADDRWTQMVRGHSSVFHEVARMSDQELERLILEHQIDILVEVTGHTGGRNRLGVLAKGAAPIQVSFLGYPNTTGHHALDYRITDAYCDPPGLTEHLHTERIVRLKNGFICFAPPDNLPQPIPSAVAENGHVTFGSFNKPTKVSNSAFSTWAAILKRVPGSRLRIKYGGSFKSQALRDRWCEVLAAKGVDPGRLEFLDPVPSLVDHFRTLGSADIALDPFPYQGTTTTLETLSMGVPVISLEGGNYCRRASSALVRRLGFDKLVATSTDEYVEIAAALAHDPERLATLRPLLRQAFLDSEICNLKAYAAELEGTYRRFWLDWCAAHPSSPVSSPPVSSTRAGDGMPLPKTLVFCSGMPRSGSTWSYNVCRLLLTETFGEENVERVYREAADAERYLTQINGSQKVHLLKLHYPGQTAMQFVTEGKAKNIYTLRDPLDALASFKEVFGDPVQSAAKRIRHSLEAADRFRRESDTLFVSFDQILGSPQDQIERLARYLGVSIDDDAVSRLHGATSLGKVKEITQTMGSQPNTKLLRAGKSLYDPETLYHVQHATKADTRDWHAELTEEEVSAAHDILGPWIDDWRQLVQDAT